jgi:hypothetical protein
LALDGFSLDSVAPLTPSGRIPTDTLVTFYIHIKNMYGIPRFGLQNGFRIYSPDGASWNNIYYPSPAPKIMHYYACYPLPV